MTTARRPEVARPARSRLRAVDDDLVLAADAGAATLDAAAQFIARYVVLPSPEALTAVTLWAAHTWAIGSWYTTPRLILDSAEPGSGKTRTLEVLALLAYKPELLFSATPAAIFRMLDIEPLTLLFDEIDTIFNPKNSATGGNEDLRALLNAGYKRGATIPRCVGDGARLSVTRFSVFAPVALAGLAGGMPDTITTRAVVIHLKRRAPTEPVHPFRERDAETLAAPIREQLSTWTAVLGPVFSDARPDLPDGIVDRPAEVWEPLVAIADAAGEHWPHLARQACVAFALNTERRGSIGTRLLADLRDLYTARQADALTTADILAALTDLDESPWADLYGKALDSRRLGKELARYGVRSRDLRQPDTRVLKGYRTDGPDGLADAWTRYLPPPASATAAASATAQVNGLTSLDQLPLPAATSATTPDRPDPPPQDHVADVAHAADPIAPPDKPLTCVVALVAPVAAVEDPPPPVADLETGPCARCNAPTPRYGPTGNPLCPTCRTAPRTGAPT